MSSDDDYGVSSAPARQALGVATVRAADLWLLTPAELGSVLGINESSVAVLRATGSVPEDADTFQRAADFVGTWLAVATRFHSDDDGARKWLRVPYRGLAGEIPIEIMKGADGLSALRAYSDSFLAPLETMEGPADGYKSGFDGTDWILRRAAIAFGTLENAQCWLSTAQAALGGRVPWALAREPGGMPEVLRAIDLADFGDYI